MSSLKSWYPKTSDNIHQQPVIGGDIFGGIANGPKSKIPQIAGVFRMISIPSRGASIINTLRIFSVYLLRYSGVGN
jgi:hypothetical protein